MSEPAIYVTKLPEAVLLDWFWAAAAERHERLELLQKIALVVVPRANVSQGEWTQRVRDETQHTIRGLRRELGCFCCFARGREMHWHHVVAVSHGGSAEARNLVRVCVACHARVHPWLGFSTVTLADEPMEAIGDILRRMKVA